MEDEKEYSVDRDKERRHGTPKCLWRTEWTDVLDTYEERGHYGQRYRKREYMLDRSTTQWFE